MNEEIEYAEMLEIPVSTVNVVRKTRRRKKSARTKRETPLFELPLKDSVIAQVNDRLDETEPQPPQPPTEELLPLDGEQNEGILEFDSIPDRIDTVRLHGEEKRSWLDRFRFKKPLEIEDFAENEGSRYEMNEDNAPSARKTRLLLRAEFAIACALCGTIFLTNVFLPESGVNTFFRTLTTPAAETAAVDTRSYADFDLSPIVSEYSSATLSLSEDGVLSFQDECCVYPAANGRVYEVTQTDGVYTLKIQYSDSFTGSFDGLDYVYYAVGEEVKANVPVGYSNGETEVKITMYSSGKALNCFRLTEENCLAWTQS
ncbi:MAG: hypothetical protein E7380_02745 [Clostridiales bacterium]|nr:hypothetical protein [Clostridiales bacterium]